MSAAAMDVDLLRAVEQFLYREARLLDERQWEAWLELIADDGRYQMPARSVPQPGKDDPLRPPAAELSTEGELFYFDDDKLVLTGRVMKLRTGKSWAEDPPSRTRRILSNIEIESTDGTDLVRVFANFVLYRSRGDHDRTMLVGHRDDLLRRVDGGPGFEILRRRAILDDTVIPTPNLAIFF